MIKKEGRNCPACNSIDKAFLGKKQGFDIYRCSYCLSLFTDRVPEVGEAQDYDAYFDDSNLATPAFVRLRVNEIVSDFEAFRNTNRLLDIGFGAGTILDVATEKNWDAYGLEVSEPAYRRAENAGYKVFLGPLMSASYPDGFFDVVTASEILEHLPNPEADLAEIARILRPGGLFWGTTPSARALSFRIMKVDWSMMAPPEHLQLYSEKGARLMLLKAGFESIRFKTHGLNPSEIIQHFRPIKHEPGTSDPVVAAGVLNEHFSRSPTRKFVKTVLNGTLSTLGLGDSLKIYARTSE